MRGSGVELALAVSLLGGCHGEPLVGGPRDSGGRPALDGSREIVSADGSTGPVYSAACWASSLPPPVQPIQPTDTIGVACASPEPDITASDWSYPRDPAGSRDDRQYIVGRWMRCGDGLRVAVKHEGIEFGANGRWRLLANTHGDPVPASPGVDMGAAGLVSGYYYMWGSGTLDLEAETAGGWNWTFFVSFADGMDAILFSDTFPTTPSPCAVPWLRIPPIKLSPKP